MLFRSIADREIRNRKAVHVRQQDADIAPVAGLRFARLPGIGPEGPFPERFGGVPGRTRMYSPFQHGAADAEDADIVQRRNGVDAGPAIRAADEVVAAAVRQPDGAVVQNQRRVSRQQDGRVDQPEAARRNQIGRASCRERV